MLKLRRLKIHKCRAVQPGTELIFNDGYNILLGKNGAGKTTLLRLIGAAIGSSFQDEFHGEELHLEYDYRMQDVDVGCTFRQWGDASAPATRAWTFDVVLRHPAHPTVTARMNGNRLTIESGDSTWSTDFSSSIGVAPSLDLVVVLGSIAISYQFPRELLDITGDRAERRLTYRLDEGLDWLQEFLRDFAVLFTPKSAEEQWCTPIVRYTGGAAAMRAALAGHRGNFADLPEVLTLHTGDLPFLRRICDQLGLEEITWTLSFLEHRRQGWEVKRYGQSQFYVTMPGGTRFPLDKLSYGQRRLFGFHLHSAMHPHVVVADELTNGMHHSMVGDCLDTIGDRQAFLATQNPLLLDHIGFADADEVHRTFLLCSLQQQNDGESLMHWRNMTNEESQEFFADYQVGIQHVNDILRTRGLW